MDLDAGTVVSRTPNTAFRELGGRAFIVAAGCPNLVGLNETATAIWRWLEAPLSIRELADKLAVEFETHSDAALADCLAFVAGLLEQQLVCVRDAGTGGAP